MGFGLYSYYVRELMAALTLFSVAFFLLALVVLGALLVWYVSVQVTNWAWPASRSMRRVFPPSDRSLRQASSPQGISQRDRELCQSEQTQESASSRIAVGGMQYLYGTEKRFPDDKG
jgi:hypothetical protein